MIPRINRWLAPPVFENDEQKTNRARLINVMINAGIIFMILIAIGNLLDKNTPPRNFVIDFLFIGIFLFLRRQLFRGKVALTGYFILISSFILMTVSAASEGTVLSPTTTLFSLLMIVAGILFNPMAIIASALASSLIVAGLIFAEHANLLPPSSYSTSIFQWFIYSVTFGLTGWLVYYSHRLINQALERSKQEINDRERVEAELRIISRVVEQSPASVVISDLDGNIEYVNSRFTMVTGYSPEEALGQNPRILKTDLTPKKTHESLWATLLAGNEWQGEFVNRKKDGSIYYESAVISPMTDNDGRVTHYLAVKEDITERKARDEKLLLSEARYRLLFEHSQDAVFIIGLDGRYLAANRRGLDLLAYPGEEFSNHSIIETSDVPEKIQNILIRVLAGEEIPPFESNTRRYDGKLVPTEVSINLARDEKGKPQHIQSVVRDMSERKRAEAALRESEAKYRIVVDNTYDWEFWSAPDGKYVYVSPSCENIIGHPASQLMADPELPGRLVHPDDRHLLDKHNQIANQRIKDSVDFRIFHKDGSLRWISHTCIPIFDDEHQYLGVRGNNRDITQQKMAEEALEQANKSLNDQLVLVNILKDQLQEQAVRDPLTNLHNRRYLNEILPRELIRAEREHTSVGLLIADVDHFKRVNDTFGHQAGDEVLKTVANLIVSNMRGSDIACRYGGEEFLLIMPGVNIEAAWKRAEEFRLKCEQISIRVAGHDLKVTISIGLVVFPQDGKQVGELLSRVDKALYYSKRAGRNKVTIWDETIT